MADNVRFLTGDVNYNDGESAVKALPPLTEETVGQVYFITDINDLQGLIVFDTKRPKYNYTAVLRTLTDTDIKNGDYYKVHSETGTDITYEKALEYEAGINFFTREPAIQNGEQVYELARITMGGSGNVELEIGDEYIDLPSIDDLVASLTNTYSSQKIEDTFLKKVDANTTYVFNTTYNSSTNKVATMTDIQNAIGDAIAASY